MNLRCCRLAQGKKNGWHCQRFLIIVNDIDTNPSTLLPDLASHFKCRVDNGYYAGARFARSSVCPHHRRCVCYFSSIQFPTQMRCRCTAHSVSKLELERFSYFCGNIFGREIHKFILIIRRWRSSTAISARFEFFCNDKRVEIACK